MLALPEGATLADYQRYIHELEAMHGWLDLDLPGNCLRMGEEVGELMAAVRHLDDATRRGKPLTGDAQRTAVAHVGEEIVDVLNYLLAIANRLGIDVEEAFRTKNAANQTRTWD